MPPTPNPSFRLRHARYTIAQVMLAGFVLASHELAAQTPRFDAQIRWTSYGIPHVKADNWGSLGYGFAYATARDAVCTMARDVVMVNGELARHFGPANGNYESDVFHRAVIDTAAVRAFGRGQSDKID